MDKHARLLLFYERLRVARPAGTHDEAYKLLCETLNAVEDEHSGVTYNPDNFRTDGRLYPPQADSARRDEDFPDVVRYRSFMHNTFIGSNGAILVKEIKTDEVQFSKFGADGKGVWG